MLSRARSELDSLMDDEESGDEGSVDEAVDPGLSQSSLAQQSASFNADFLLILSERSRAAELTPELSKDARAMLFFSGLTTSSEVDDEDEDMFLPLPDCSICMMGDAGGNEPPRILFS